MRAMAYRKWALAPLLFPLVLTTLLVASAGPASSAVGGSFVPTADTYVDTSTFISNFGTSQILAVDGSPTKRSYLRFNVTGIGSVSSATLRLFVQTSGPGFDVRRVSGNVSEGAMVSAFAPSAGALIATTGPVTAGQWVAVNVSSAVIAPGNVSFALTTTQSLGMNVASRESANAPQLDVTSRSLFLVSQVNATTYKAVSQPDGFTITGPLKSVVESATSDLNLTGGGTIRFAAGTFDIGVDHFYLRNMHNIVFEGQGIDATLLRNDTGAAAADTEPFDFGVSSHITIRDMTINGGGLPRTTSDAIDFDNGSDNLVERVKITGSRSRGIVFDGKDSGAASERNVVRNCIIEGIRDDGIELLASSNAIIEGCQITGVGGNGIQANKSSALATQANKKSTDNTIRNNTIVEAARDGINVNSSDRNRIVNNVIRNNANGFTADGIRITSLDNISCDGNVVDANGATDDQAVKTQRYGLNIASSLCANNVVGVNDLSGNRVGPINDLGTNTIYGTIADTEAPTVPGGLSANAASGIQVDLSWSASVDNGGVAGYTIYRDGGQIAQVNGSTLAYSDTSAAPQTTYAYQVDALDAAGNHSAFSDPASVTTPAQASITRQPAADATVDGAAPATNFGQSGTLRCKANTDARSYIRFDLPGSVVSAKLKVYVNNAAPHPGGFEVRGVSDNTWTEAGLTHANAPAMGPIVGSSGGLAGPGYVEIDVTSLLVGQSSLSLALTTPSNTQLSLGSGESVNPPLLVLAFG